MQGLILDLRALVNFSGWLGRDNLFLYANHIKLALFAKRKMVYFKSTTVPAGDEKDLEQHLWHCSSFRTLVGNRTQPSG